MFLFALLTPLGPPVGFTFNLLLLILSSLCSVIFVFFLLVDWTSADVKSLKSRNHYSPVFHSDAAQQRRISLRLFKSIIFIHKTFRSFLKHESCESNRSSGCNSGGLTC